MSEFKRTIASQRGLLERLAQRIPGFRGYYDAENRREADHLLRAHGVAELERVASRLHEHKRAAPLAALQPLEALMIRVETLRNELRYAERGYAGFFDEIKWDRPEMLDAVHARDEEIVQAIGALALAVEGPELEPGQVSERITDLRRAVEERQRSILSASPNAR
jgi:hypothetical protein